MSIIARNQSPRRLLPQTAVGFLSLMVAALVLPAAVLASAVTPRDAQVLVMPESRLWIEGTSSVRAYQCHATKLDGQIGLAGEPGVGVESFAGAVNAVSLDIPLESFDCRNGQMNGHMRGALKANEHPVIQFRMKSHEDALTAEGTLTVTLTGTLAIAGQEKEITLTATVVQDTAGQYRVTGSHELDMTEWGVKPPRLMFGTLKVHDKVMVRYDILLGTAL
ncbi:MAG TPA: YceI family protein [Gemmatimonadaceae bacterium]